MSEACVILFAKPPLPGKVKTRLVGGSITADRAATLYAAFLQDMIARLSGSADFDLALAWARDDEDREMPDLGVPGFVQEGDDLGDRMVHALARMARRYRHVIVLGTDHPDLPAERVTQAVAWLRQGAAAVIGPSEDGGYYLLGLPAERVDACFFADVEWSTPGVLTQTLSRFEEHNVTPRLLPAAADVDRPADLHGLWQRLEGNASHAPATLAVLRSWGGSEDRA